MLTIDSLAKPGFKFKVGVSLDGLPLEAHDPLQKPLLLMLAENSETVFASPEKSKETLEKFWRGLKCDSKRITDSKHLDFNDAHFLILYLAEVFCLPKNEITFAADLKERLEALKTGKERLSGEAEEVAKLIESRTQESVTLYLKKSFQIGAIDSKKIVLEIYGPMRKFFDLYLKK